MLMLLLGLFVMASITAAIISVLSFILGLTYFKKHISKKKAIQKGANEALVVGLFHPYCNAGGGGERVLWCAIKALQIKYPDSQFVVYTGDIEASPDEIITRVKQRFNIILPSSVQFVYLRKRKWVEASRYPYFTLLGQSLGSVALGIEAMSSVVPDIFIDTMGYAFTLPLFKYIAQSKVGAYVHYPTISTDMLRRVASRAESFNNRGTVARNPFLTAGKLLYYRLFAMLYGYAGRCADIVMVNSSWTENHINTIWKISERTLKVYPPCDVEEFKKIPITDRGQNTLQKIISLAQFRPEKDHPLQIRTMFQLRQMLPESIWENLRLVLIGSCRDSADAELVKDMQDLSKHLAVDDNVQFKINVTFEELKAELQEGMIGIHTMWNEHFGIGVVECMASGLVMIANKSGGPKMDIVIEDEGSRNGFLATDEAEYACAITSILHMSPKNRMATAERARASVERFSEAEFEHSFLRAVEPLFR